MRFAIVDVFAERRFAGNQLAVVRESGALDPAVMQQIALEMNFSETTFVTRETESEADARIFTPVQELPFAGHPTIGTAWVLGHDRAAYRLNLGAGAVDVTFDGPDGVVWMTPPEPELGVPIVPADAARLVGLAPAELHPEYPACCAAVGPEFALVGVKDLVALRRVELSLDVREELIAREIPAWAVLVFAPGGYTDDAHYAARMLFVAGSVREDPATGSANSCFAAYLRELGRSGAITVQQGFEIARPSTLYLRIGETLQVGGRVQAVAEGELHA